ncbi:hypothetical protein BaRGS_00020540 [Batillaria attramentaria]|uniref:G-protein coupled receptors family 1 profile domain-containing protein n=1 Tax=Batillaria attramentaria TaxID=370345 RepID=A0ABD0KMV2_9CAEN
MYPGCHNVTYSDPGNDSGLPHYEQCEAYTSSMGRTGDYIVGTCLIFITPEASLTLSTLILRGLLRELQAVCADEDTWPSCCVINGFLGFFFGIADIFVLSLLSFTRFLCVCCPMTSTGAVATFWSDREGRLRSSVARKVLLSLLAALSLAGFWALCPLVGWGVYGPEPFGTSCTLDWAAPDRSYVTCVFMVCLALPLTVMTVSYGSILHSTSAASRRLRRHGGDGRLRRARHEIRLIKITLLMSVCFLAAWTPYAVVSMASAYMEDLEVPGTVSIFPTLLAKTSHLSNPVVYFVMNSRFSRQRPWCSVPFVGSRMSSSSCSGRALQGDDVHLEYLRKARFVQQPVESVVGAGTLLAECTLVTSNAVSVQAESDVTSSPAASEESNGLSRRMESDQDHLSTDEHEKACCEAAVTTERKKDRAPSKDKDLARKRPRGKSRPKKEGRVSTLVTGFPEKKIPKTTEIYLVSRKKSRVAFRLEQVNTPALATDSVTAQLLDPTVRVDVVKGDSGSLLCGVTVGDPATLTLPSYAVGWEQAVTIGWSFVRRYGVEVRGVWY